MWATCGALPWASKPTAESMCCGPGSDRRTPSSPRFMQAPLDGGATWSPLQLLDTGNAFDPQIAVDDSHQIVHLVYRSNSNGIVHRTVVEGLVSDLTVGCVSWGHHGGVAQSGGGHGERLAARAVDSQRLEQRQLRCQVGGRQLGRPRLEHAVQPARGRRRQLVCPSPPVRMAA